MISLKICSTGAYLRHVLFLDENAVDADLVALTVKEV